MECRRYPADSALVSLDKQAHHIQDLGHIQMMSTSLQLTPMTNPVSNAAKNDYTKDHKRLQYYNKVMTELKMIHGI